VVTLTEGCLPHAPPHWLQHDQVRVASASETEDGRCDLDSDAVLPCLLLVPWNHPHWPEAWNHTAAHDDGLAG